MSAKEALSVELQKSGELAILAEYLPILKKLKTKEKELDLLLAKNDSDGKVPKYAVSVKSTIKSIYFY